MCTRVLMSNLNQVAASYEIDHTSFNQKEKKTIEGRRESKHQRLIYKFNILTTIKMKLILNFFFCITSVLSCSSIPPQSAKKCGIVKITSMYQIVPWKTVKFFIFFYIFFKPHSERLVGVRSILRKSAWANWYRSWEQIVSRLLLVFVTRFIQPNLARIMNKNENHN